MKVVVLCAGYATRLHPLTENTPKPLLPVGGKPILEWILDKIENLSNVEAVYVVTNQKFAEHFNNWKKTSKHSWPVIVVNDKTTENEKRLGAIGDLNYAIKTEKLPPSDLLVLAGDNFFDFDLVKFIEKTKTLRPHGALAAYDIGDLEIAKKYGLVRIDSQSRVLEFQEKPSNPFSTLVSCGIYWLPIEIWQLLDKYIELGNNTDQPGNYMRWLAETVGLFAFSFKGIWLDIGDIVSYQRANEIIKNASNI